MTAFRLDAWDAFADLIEEALERPAGERGEFLRRSVPDDTQRATVEQLLSWAEEAAGFLAGAAADAVPELVSEAFGPPEAPELPERIGPYRVVGLLGRGGMGEVYLGERMDAAFERRVALKMVRGAGAGSIERFRHERRVLAALDHPHIARLFDGGVTDDGRPWFVMEVVEGEPLDRYCDARRLGVEARLGLFEQVCEAVAHAHRALVVHRDLKPSNILVDGEGRVKLLDFGLAKVLEDDGATGGEAPETRVGVRVLTPEYASPEQFLGDPVSTASDVYSLGVLLHHLLTGVGPYPPGTAGTRALERAALEGAVSRPGATVGGADAEARARTRSTTPERLRRRLRGDLDTVVLMALQRDPASRYASVDALLDDVRRHRAGHPIRARRPTWRYRTGRFVRRHRAGVAVAALAAVALATALGTALRQGARASREAVRAERIRDFLVGVFEVSDPDRARGATVPARDLLDRGAARAEIELAGEPELLADMLAVFGTLYRNLGLLERADSAFRRGVELRRSQGADPALLAGALTDAASVAFARDDHTGAEALLREALALVRSSGRASGIASGATLALAASLSAQARYDEALPLYEEVLAARRADGDSVGVGEVLNGLGLAMLRTGRPDEARRMLEHALELREGALGSLHTDVAVSRCNLAMVAQSAGDYPRARDEYARCLDIRRRILEPDHPDIGLALNNLAIVVEAMGDFEAADSLYRAGLDIRRRVFGEPSAAVAGSLNNLAVLAYRQGDYAGAARTFRELHGQWRELVGADHPNTITALNNLGMTLMAGGEEAEAEPVLRQALATRIRVLGDAHPEVAGSHANLAALLTRLGRHQEAEDEARTAVRLYDAAYPDGHPDGAGALVALTRALHAQGRCGEGLAAAERAATIRAERQGEEHRFTAAARTWVGRCLAQLGRRQEAVDVLSSALSVLERVAGPDDAATVEARQALEEARGG